MGHSAWGVTLQFANFVFIFQLLFSEPYFWYFELHILLLFCMLDSQFHDIFSALCFSKWSRPGISYFLSKIIAFLVDSLYAEAIENGKVTCFFISFIKRINIYIWRYKFIGESLK
jgi:hypothetical protein